MTEIVIPLTEGYNFISFPSASVYAFGDILTSSTIKDKITKFIKYHPILGEIPILDSDHIEEGIGYRLYITIPGSIIYESIGDYYITFDQLKSRILKGWNLLATGNNTIILPSWCNVIDANTGIYATRLEPMKAYWINYDDCLQPTFNAESALYVIGAIGTVLFTIYLLREFRIIGKPMKD
jgi:hypothetical protein